MSLLKRIHWYSSLKAKVTMFMIALSLLGLTFLAVVFIYMEHKMMADFETKQVTLIENFVGSTLRPLMLTGQATVMPTILENYKHVAGLAEIKIVRKSGVEAFSDKSTIKKVNDYIDVQRFDRDFMRPPMQIVESDDPRFQKVLTTGKKMVFEAELDDGTHEVQMLIPFRNEEECHACHGYDQHAVRGVMMASFPIGEMEKNITSDLVDITKYAFLAIVIMTGGMFFLFNRVVLKPVSEMVEQVNSIVGSESYDARIKVTSDDEIGDLAVVFNSFITAVEDYQHQQATEKDRLEAAVREKTKELLEKNRIIEDDLKLAERVQQRLLPSRLPEIKGYRFQARYTPCMYIGGDFYDLFELPNGKLGVFMADATGHGPSAALLVSIVKTLLVGYAREMPHPADMVKEINTFLARITPDDAFVTLFYGVVDLQEHTIDYCLAGHPSPIIHNSRNDEMKTLELSGGLVGSFEDSTFGNEHYTFEPGDRLLIYTDGLVEAQSPGGQEFGEEHVGAVLKFEKDLDVSRVLDMLNSRLLEHTGGAALADDVTMLVVDFERD